MKKKKANKRIQYKRERIKKKNLADWKCRDAKSVTSLPDRRVEGTRERRVCRRIGASEKDRERMNSGGGKKSIVVCVCVLERGLNTKRDRLGSSRYIRAGREVEAPRDVFVFRLETRRDTRRILVPFPSILLLFLYVFLDFFFSTTIGNGNFLYTFEVGFRFARWREETRQDGKIYIFRWYFYVFLRYIFF